MDKSQRQSIMPYSRNPQPVAPGAPPAARRLSRADRELFGLWFLLRLLSWGWAILVSGLVAVTTRERAIALWPPAAPYGAWLERVLLAPFERRDTVYYVNIVARGYRSDDGTAQFHPLLAWLATPIAWLSGQPLLGLLLVSSCAGLLVLPAFERLARLDLEPAAARGSTLLLAFSPLAFVFFIPYTEGLFLLWAVLCLFWARQGRWWLAGLAGALATLTRQQGLFLLLPLAWEMWEAMSAERRTMKEKWRPSFFILHPSSFKKWLALGMIPAGLLLLLVYRAFALNDLRADFSHPQTLIYTLLISPSSAKVVPNQAFLLPPHALWLALEKLWRAPEYSLLIDLLLGLGFVVLLVLAWRHMRTSYRLYALVITLVSFAYYTGPHYPYMGLPRHLLLAFPVFIGLGAVFRPGRLPHMLLVTFGMLGMFFLLLQYGIHGWVP